jgi:hypothetical protein
MTRADCLYSRPPLHAPIRSFLIEGFAVVLILVSADVAGCLIASGLSGKIARHCAVDLQRALQ